MEHTTVKELVDKCKSMQTSLTELRIAIEQLQGGNFHSTETIQRAEKDKRYSVQVLLQNYKRIEADLDYLETTPVRLLND